MDDEREIIAHSKYGASKTHPAVTAEVHFFVDKAIPERDLTPERLQRAFQKWLRTGDAGKGFAIELIDWKAGKKSNEDYDGDPVDSLNAGLRRALREGKLDLGDE